VGVVRPTRFESRIWEGLTVLLYIYIALTLVMGISALAKGAIYPGIAGIVGPTLCWFAASGLKGSFMVGSSRQKLGRLGNYWPVSDVRRDTRAAAAANGQARPQRRTISAAFFGGVNGE
jgi:hypothetical protein